MNNVNFGLKLWSINTNLIEQAIGLINEKVFDYIELFIVPGTQITPFNIDVPYIIHIPHHAFGLNIGEASKKEYNLKTINESISWADVLGAKYLILHAGYGYMEHAMDLLNELNDNRILIENMPKVGLDGQKMIGYSHKQMEELIGNNKGLCLDFGHAVKAALSLGEDYKEYIKKFLVFKPEVFHISDGTLTEEKDEHMNMGEGEYDFEYLSHCICRKSPSFVTMETPRSNKYSLSEDIRNVEFLKNVIKVF
jgi:deoxyribonuclease-4